MRGCPISRSNEAMGLRREHRHRAHPIRMEASKGPLPYRPPLPSEQPVPLKMPSDAIIPTPKPHSTW